MVAPTTGPFNRTESAYGPLTHYGHRPEWMRYTRSSHRQRRPYNLPLSYTYARGQVMTWVNYSWPLIAYREYSNVRVSIFNVNLSTTTWFPGTYNKAYERFKSKLKPTTAGLGIMLAQRQEALSMIEKRGRALAHFALQLRRGNFRLAAFALGLDRPPPGLKKKGKAFADNFLEFHFGWSPLIGDMHAAIDVLQGGVPPTRITASARSVQEGKSNTSTLSDPIYYNRWTDDCVWKIGSDALVTNPNLFLANQLGLVNPAAVVWDAIPFSFVLGWFVNVSSFLESFTDTWGISLTNSYVTCHTTRDATEKEVQKNWPSANAYGTINFSAYNYVRTQRSPGSAPGPTLRIKEPWILSPSRGLTAISLLLQRLKA